MGIVHGFASLLRNHLGREVDEDTRHFLGHIVAQAEEGHGAECRFTLDGSDPAV